MLTTKCRWHKPQSWAYTTRLGKVITHISKSASLLWITTALEAAAEQAVTAMTCLAPFGYCAPCSNEIMFNLSMIRVMLVWLLSSVTEYSTGRKARRENRQNNSLLQLKGKEYNLLYRAKKYLKKLHREV